MGSVTLFTWIFCVLLGVLTKSEWWKDQDHTYLYLLKSINDNKYRKIKTIFSRRVMETFNENTSKEHIKLGLLGIHRNDLIKCIIATNIKKSFATISSAAILPVTSSIIHYTTQNSINKMFPNKQANRNCRSPSFFNYRFQTSQKPDNTLNNCNS